MSVLTERVFLLRRECVGLLVERKKRALKKTNAATVTRAVTSAVTSAVTGALQ